MLRSLNRVALWTVCVLCFAATLSAGEKKLMHCFTFTSIEAATTAEWQAFYDATDALPGKIPGLNRVWYGKLLRDLSIYNPDSDARKQLSAGAESATGKITQRTRQYGVCMEMDDQAALKAYSDHPAHKEWSDAYSKVRQPGTTTFDLLGQ